MTLESAALITTKKVLTIDEVVQYTGFAKRQIYRFTSESIIPHSKPTGRKIFFEREKIEAWLLSGQVKTNKEINDEAERRVAAMKDKKKR